MSNDGLESDHGITRRPYVVSEDLDLVLSSWCIDNNFILPAPRFFTALRYNMKQVLEEIFEDVVFVDKINILKSIDDYVLDNEFTVSLDRIYFKGHYFLDVTRLVDVDGNCIGLGSRNSRSLDIQLSTLAKRFHGKNIAIFDDVIFSGDGIIEIINLLNSYNIIVDKVIAGIIIGESAQNIVDTHSSQNYSLQVLTNVYIEDVVDEICERDFYFGVPFSGRSVGIVKNGMAICPDRFHSLPYFMPFGKPYEWASIPLDRCLEWSRFCIKQSIELWQEISRLSNRSVLISDLSRKSLVADQGSLSACSFLKKSLNLF